MAEKDFQAVDKPVVSDEPSKTAIEGTGGARGLGETIADGAYNVTKYVWDTTASGISYVADKSKEAGGYLAEKGSEAGHYVADKVDVLKQKVTGDGGATDTAAKFVEEVKEDVTE